MKQVKLTKREVDRAEPKGERYTLFDSMTPGFGLRVYPSGQKSWIFEYRPGGGGRRVAKRRVTIGKFGDFTPDQARKKAEAIRALVLMGRDPQAEKTALRQAPTVAEIAKLFVEQHIGVKRKASTKAMYDDAIRRLILPALGKLKAKGVTRADVSRMHVAHRATPYQANRAVAILGSMYSYAGKHGLVPEGYNPARGIDRFKEEGRERFLSTAELERLGAALRLAETDGIPWRIRDEKKLKHVPKAIQANRLDPYAVAALRLLIFTGARLREILHLKWEHVDFERGVLRLPDSKTGKKTIVLNGPALDLLNRLERSGAYVIASESAGQSYEKPRSDLKRPWHTIRRHAGLEDVRLHDLRHSFASFGAGGGLGLPMIGKLLGHSQPQTTARYAHLDADPVRRASDAIGATIAAAMGDMKTGTVVRLKPKG
jgi:integrase